MIWCSIDFSHIVEDWSQFCANWTRASEFLDPKTRVIYRVFNNLLRTFEKSPKSLIPFPSPNGSFDCSHQAVFLEKILSKKTSISIFSSKMRKKLRFSSFYPQYFFCRLWLIFCTGGFCHGEHEYEAIF
jgi:hypothetical protein